MDFNKVENSGKSSSYQNAKNVQATQKIATNKIKKHAKQNLQKTTKATENTSNKSSSSNEEHYELVFPQTFGTKEQFDKAIETANKSLAGTNSHLSYDVHKGTNRLMIKILDNETKEVIREFPPEKDLDILAKILEQTGLLFDTTK